MSHSLAARACLIRPRPRSQNFETKNIEEGSCGEGVANGRKFQDHVPAVGREWKAFNIVRRKSHNLTMLRPERANLVFQNEC